MEKTHAKSTLLLTNTNLSFDFFLPKMIIKSKENLNNNLPKLKAIKLNLMFLIDGSIIFMIAIIKFGVRMYF